MSETTSNILAQDSLSRKSLAFCGYTGYAAIILFIIGGVWLGGMLPPIPNANDAPAELVAKVNENLLGFRVGSIFLVASFALFGTVGAGIAAQTRRFETSPVFSYAQIVFAAGGTTVALLVAWGWALMAFRPDTYEPSILLMWADFAYFLAVFSVPLFGGWCVLIALPILFQNRKGAISAVGSLCKPMGGFALRTRPNDYIFQRRAVFLAWHCWYVPAIHRVLCLDSHHVLVVDQDRP